MHGTRITQQLKQSIPLSGRCCYFKINDPPGDMNLSCWTPLNWCIPNNCSNTIKLYINNHLKYNVVEMHTQKRITLTNATHLNLIQKLDKVLSIYWTGFSRLPSSLSWWVVGMTGLCVEGGGEVSKGVVRGLECLKSSNKHLSCHFNTNIYFVLLLPHQWYL